MKENKTNKVIIVLLIILTIITLLLSGYIVYDKVITKDDSKESKTKVDDKNELNDKKSESLPEKNSEHNFVKMLSKEVILEGKTHTILYYFYNDKISLVDFNNKLSGEIFFDNKKVVDLFTENYYKNENELNDSLNSFEKELQTLNYEKIIDSASNSKEYLLLNYRYTSKSEYMELTLDHVVSKSILIDKDSNVLDSYYTSYPCPTASLYIKASKNEEGRHAEYNSNLNSYILYNNSYLDINSNYMYYLDVSSGENKMLNSIDEYKITIENGKVNKVKTKTYTGNEIDGAGGC